MKKVFAMATGYDVLCKDGLKLLEDNGCTVEFNAYGRPYTLEELQAVMADVDGVIANMEQWNKQAMDASPNLKVIARFGTGYDTVNLEEAKKHGIVVTNCPGLNAPAVAEQAIALMMALSRQISTLNEATKAGFWPRTMFNEISGKTIGILGLGNVGCNLARMLSGFGVSILAYNRTPKQDLANELGIELCNIDRVFAESDVIFICLACNPYTQHIINSEAIAKMKKNVFIINTARGALVDEKAVYEALNTGLIAGFGTDVFESEPVDKNNPLLGLKNVVCSPHAAGQTYENYRNTGIATAQAVLDVFAGNEPANRKA